MEVLLSTGTTCGLSDGQLLQRFASGEVPPADAEAAFAALVARHAALVWGICLRKAGDHHEAEDAFQATFLILSRQAGSIWVHDSLGGWLRRVATRVATRARAEASRRRSGRGEGVAAAEPDPRLAVEREELREAVADELSRLPEKYRSPVELCHIRGLKQDEAARALDLPVGTIKSRLDRARRRLREGLLRRGLLAPSATAAAAGASSEASAAAPAALVRATLRAAIDQTRGGVLPASVATLAELCSGVAVATKAQIGVAVAAGAALAFMGAGSLGFGPLAAPPGGAGPAAVVDQAQNAIPPRRLVKPDVAGLTTFHEEAGSPDPDLGEAILQELRNERR